VEDFGARALFAREHAPAYAMNSVQTEHDSCAICARVNDAVGSPAGPEGSPSFPSQRNDDGPWVLCCGKRGVRTARFPRTLWAPLLAVHRSGSLHGRCRGEPGATRVAVSSRRRTAAVSPAPASFAPDGRAAA
jgi:hypothetical protein